MVKWRAHIAFILLMSLYFFTRYLRVEFDQLPNFIKFHLTDLIFVPAMCLFALIIIRFRRRDSELIISWQSIAIQVLLVCLYFEWFLPNNTPTGHLHVADFFDCIMYMLGGVLFWMIQPLLTIGTKKIGTRSTDSEM